MKPRITRVVCLLAVTAVTSTAMAAVIPLSDIQSANSSSVLIGYGDHSPINVFNSAGLSNDPVGSQTHGDYAGDPAVPNVWQTAAGDKIGSWISVTFTEAYDITELRVWNHRAQWWRGAKDVSIVTSDGTTSTPRGTFTIDQGDLQPTTGQVITLGSAWQNVKTITFTVQSMHMPDQGHVGLAEVQFTGTATVPEPVGAGALVLVGGLGALARRRRSSGRS